jgi:hypothetical protein
MPVSQPCSLHSQVQFHQQTTTPLHPSFLQNLGNSRHNVTLVALLVLGSAGTDSRGREVQNSFQRLWPSKISCLCKHVVHRLTGIWCNDSVPWWY